jgi:hypothetical protein
MLPPPGPGGPERLFVGLPGGGERGPRRAGCFVTRLYLCLCLDVRQRAQACPAFVIAYPALAE